MRPVWQGAVSVAVGLIVAALIAIATRGTVATLIMLAPLTAMAFDAIVWDD